MFELSWHDGETIAAIRLHRPPANAIGLKEIRELFSLLERVDREVGCRALIFYAQGRFFSAGADIALMAELADAPDGPERLTQMGAEMQATFAKLEQLSIPTFCAISGICVGGGLELALACDIRVAERSATLGLPEVRIGLLPGAGGTQRLAAVAGLPVARRLILTGDLISGEAAQRLGIVQDLAAQGKAFESALEMARSVTSAPRRTLEGIKRCLALASSPEGFAAELEETLALHREDQTRALIGAFLARSKKKVAV